MNTTESLKDYQQVRLLAIRSVFDISEQASEGTLIVDRGGWKIYGRRNSLAGDATDSQTPHLRNFMRGICRSE